MDFRFASALVEFCLRAVFVVIRKVKAWTILILLLVDQGGGAAKVVGLI